MKNLEIKALPNHIYLMIFKSLTSGAIYSYNGKETVCIVGNDGMRGERKVGKIMQGFYDQQMVDYLDKMFYLVGDDGIFNLGDSNAEYQILFKVKENSAGLCDICKHPKMIRTGDFNEPYYEELYCRFKETFIEPKNEEEQVWVCSDFKIEDRIL